MAMEVGQKRGRDDPMEVSMDRFNDMLNRMFDQFYVSQRFAQDQFREKKVYTFYLDSRKMWQEGIVKFNVARPTQTIPNGFWRIPLPRQLQEFRVMTFDVYEDLHDTENKRTFITAEMRSLHSIENVYTVNSEVTSLESYTSETKFQDMFKVERANIVATASNTLQFAEKDANPDYDAGGSSSDYNALLTMHQPTSWRRFANPIDDLRFELFALSVGSKQAKGEFTSKQIYDQETKDSTQHGRAYPWVMVLEMRE